MQRGAMPRSDVSVRLCLDENVGRAGTIGDVLAFSCSHEQRLANSMQFGFSAVSSRKRISWSAILSFAITGCDQRTVFPSDPAGSKQHVAQMEKALHMDLSAALPLWQQKLLYI